VEIDPSRRRMDAFVLREGEYREVTASTVIAGLPLTADHRHLHHSSMG
jgi:hypothetical protein